MNKIPKKWLNFGLVVTFMLAAFEQPAYAAEESSEEKTLNEVGVTLLMPALLNLNVGLWGIDGSPFVVRASGMYWGQSVHGAQAEFGYLLSRSETFKHYVGLEMIHLYVNRTDEIKLTGVGPSYGLNWNGFSAQAGLAFGSSSVSGRDTGPAQLTLQVGYTILW